MATRDERERLTALEVQVENLGTEVKANADLAQKVLDNLAELTSEVAALRQDLAVTKAKGGGILMATTVFVSAVWATLGDKIKAIAGIAA